LPALHLGKRMRAIIQNQAHCSKSVGPDQAGVCQMIVWLDDPEEAMRWWTLGTILTFAVGAYLLVLLISADQAWRSASPDGWLFYLAPPAASLALSVGATAVVFFTTRRKKPAALTGTVVLVICDVAAGAVLSQYPFLF
jgi:cytochrome bd-type quinol oxidase subunit 2